MSDEPAGDAAVASLAELGPAMDASREGKVISWRAVGLGGALILFVGVYFFLATILVREVNRDYRTAGQERVLIAAETVGARAAEPPAEIGVTEILWRYLPHYTDGVIEPLWPWVAGQFASEDRDVSFVRGKWCQVIISAAFCCILALCASRTFTLAATLNLAGLAAFGVFLRESVYLGAEVFFYVFFFLSWACSVMVLRRNSTWSYALLGVLFGLAYLSKAAALPLMIFFLLVSTGHWLESLIHRKRRIRKGEPEGKWLPQNHFIGLAFLAAGFLAVTGARLYYAEEAFGNPWHSYAAATMWLDSPEEAAEFIRAHPGAEALESLGENAAPSVSSYLETHGWAEAGERLREGGIKVVTDFLRPPRASRGGGEMKPWEGIFPLRGYYLAALFIILCVVGCVAQIARHHHDEGPSRAESRSARLVAVYLLGATALYTAGYGWYARVEPGDDLLMMLFLPLVFSFIWGAESFLKSLPAGEAAKVLKGGYTVVHLILLGSIGYRITELVRYPLFDL